MNEIYKLKNEMDRLKPKIKDQDNDMADKAKLSLLEYETLFLLKNEQFIMEKLLDLNSNKTNVCKPCQQSTIHP